MNNLELCPACKSKQECLFEKAKKETLNSITPDEGKMATKNETEDIKRAFSLYLDAAVIWGCKQAINLKLRSLGQQVSVLEILKENQGQKPQTRPK